MRSSGSTPSLRCDGGVRLWLIVAGEDHPRACTGRKLIARRLAREVRGPAAPRPGAIVLDPQSPVPLSARDRPRARRAGVVAVDCSWNRLAGRGRLPDTATRANESGHRRLPFLLATNPQHFGRLAELNTAEALGAALYVLGAREQAVRLLAGFAGGSAFFDVNRERLERYSRADRPRSVLAAEAELFGPAAAT